MVFIRNRTLALVSLIFDSVDIFFELDFFRIIFSQNLASFENMTAIYFTGNVRYFCRFKCMILKGAVSLKMKKKYIQKFGRLNIYEVWCY